MDNFIRSRCLHSKSTNVENLGFQRSSWRQHSQPQMSNNISDDLLKMRDALARKRSLPRPPVIK
uniref:Uncharacterized protein n=1 Tax=Setaria digitata TaxID=48799 RepID=A0A915PHP7_9BILA